MDTLSIKLAIENRIMSFAQRIKVSPNAITLCALLINLAASVLVFAESLFVAASLIVIAGAMDILDGAVAKAHNKATAFGALLDRVSDRVSDFALLAALIAAGYIHVMLGLYVLLTVMLASYISACIEAATKSRVGEKFSLRAVRIVLIVLGCITMRMDETMLAMAVLGTYASLARMVQAYRILSTSVHA